MLKTLLDLEHISLNSDTLQSRAMKHLCDPEAIMQIVQDFDPDVLRFVSEKSFIGYRLSDTTTKILNIVLCSHTKNIYTQYNQIIIETDFSYLRKYDKTELMMTLKKIRYMLYSQIL